MTSHLLDRMNLAYCNIQVFLYLSKKNMSIAEMSTLILVESIDCYNGSKLLNFYTTTI